MKRSTSLVFALAFIWQTGLTGLSLRAAAEENRPPGAAAAGDAAEKAEDSLAVVIERVRENEKLYRQLELTTRKTTKVRDGNVEGPMSLIEFQTVHSIVQDDLVYCRVTALSKTSAGAAPARNSVSAYDGEKTRSVEYGNSVNIHLGRYESAHLFPPHCWPLSNVHVNFPLSILLEGTEAMRRQPKVHHRPEAHGFVGDFHRVESSLDGEEDIAGLRCVKILCRWWYNAKNRPLKHVLWLAPDRNYLCLKWQSMSDLGGREAVGLESQVDQLQEIAPKLWLPVRVTYRQYDFEALRQGQDVVRREVTCAVQKAIFNPGRPRTFFSDIEIPNGIPLYTIEDGRLAGRSFKDTPAPDSSAVRLSEIIEKVKANERLYESIAVELEKTYRHFHFTTDGRPTDGAGAGFGGGRYVAATRTIEKSIIQSGKTWYSARVDTDYHDGSTSREVNIEVGDGKSTKIRNLMLDDSGADVADEKNVTTSIGRPGHDRAHRPHTLLERDVQIQRPLSALLSSKWDEEYHAGEVQVEALGEDEREGHPCEVVRVVDLLKNGRGRNSVRLLWLAKDRNYIPIREEHYALTLDEHLPIAVRTVTVLREISPDVWFPFKASCVVFERTRDADLSTGRLVVMYGTDYRTEKVTLDPNVPPEQFSKIELPEE